MKYRCRACLVLAISLGWMAFSVGFDRAHATVSSTQARVPPLRHLMRCLGSTRAHVRISWPTSFNLTTDRKLHWGKRVSKPIRRWAYLILPAARSAGIDPYFVAGVMQVESRGDPLAWNLDSDARGLMQVLHSSFQPAVNIRLGVSMLASFEHQFSKPDLALAAYNAGPENVQSYGGIPPFTETRDYVIMVDYYRDQFAGLSLSATRTWRFKHAVKDLEAFHRRICSRP